MANKWFYKAQAEAALLINKQFPNAICTFQVIQKDRVIEQYFYYELMEATEPANVQLQIVKRGANISIFIYKMKQVSAYQI